MLIRDAMTEKKEPSAQEVAQQQEGQASGDEQNAYERMVLAGINAVGDEAMSKSLVEMMKSTQNPAEGLSQAAALIVGEVDKQGDFPETVIIPAASEILENVAELAQSARVYKVDQNTVQEAQEMLELNLAEMYGVDPQDPDFQEMIKSTNQDEIMAGKYGSAK